MEESVYTPDRLALYVSYLRPYVKVIFWRHRRHSGVEARMFGRLVPDSRTPVIPMFRNRAAKNLTGI